jgi:hypothetical protein
MTCTFDGVGRRFCAHVGNDDRDVPASKAP